jgi:hypothetical protein
LASILFACENKTLRRCLSYRTDNYPRNTEKKEKPMGPEQKKRKTVADPPTVGGPFKIQ